MSTDPAGRMQSLDILRGLALLGMFIVHFHVRSTEPGGLDDTVRTLIWRLVESKSHGTFALLFGAGFAIQLRRAEDRGGPFAGFYLRRLAVLAVAGCATHALLGFNVLLGYAVWGVPLLLVRRWSTPALLVLAGVSAASVRLSQIGAAWWLQATPGADGAAVADQARRMAAMTVAAALQAAEDQESYARLLTARLHHMAWFYTQPFFLLPNATLALFISGFLLVRHRVFEEALGHARLLGGLAAFGVLSWTADNWLLPSWHAGDTGLLRDQWLMFAYVAGALLLLARAPALAYRLRGVADAGRMALTNYLLQVGALDILFSGYGLGLGRVRPAIGLAAACACFAAEAVFSTLWLRHFRFGPAEWAWRSLTYGRVQPMRRAPAPSDSAPLSI